MAGITPVFFGKLRLNTFFVQSISNTASLFSFPKINATNGKGKEGRGIGSHTDYGLLVIAAQDDVGGKLTSLFHQSLALQPT